MWRNIKRWKCIAVCWQLGILCRSVRGQQQVTVLNRTVQCVTLWLLYVGRTGETSEDRLLWLWLWTSAALMLYWGSSNLDITTAGIVGTSHCWCVLGYCTVLMLAVLTDGRWKLAATYCNTIRCHHMAWCCRQTQEVLHPAEWPPAALQHQSDSGQQVSSLPDIVQEDIAICFLQINALNIIWHCSLAVWQVKQRSVSDDNLHHFS